MSAAASSTTQTSAFCFEDDEEEPQKAEEPELETKIDCMYCNDDTGKTHPLFLYVITDSRVKLCDIKSKEQVYVGVSCQPLVRCRCHNREPGFRAGVKQTKAVSPHWEWQVIMPLQSHARHHKKMAMEVAKVQSERDKIPFITGVINYILSLSSTESLEFFVRSKDDIKSLIVNT